MLLPISILLFFNTKRSQQKKNLDILFINLITATTEEKAVSKLLSLYYYSEKKSEKSYTNLNYLSLFIKSILIISHFFHCVHRRI